MDVNSAVKAWVVVLGASQILLCGSANAQSAGEPLVRKAGDGFTLLTRGGEVSIYGNLDVSLDDTTKGIANMTAAGAPTTPPGRTGWLPAISTNLSYVGVRGFQSLALKKHPSSV